MARTAPCTDTTWRNSASHANATRTTGSDDEATGARASVAPGHVPATASVRSDTRSGKYRYAVASDTRACRATSGIVTSPPLRIRDAPASTIAVRVRRRWLARPAPASIPTTTSQLIVRVYTSDESPLAQGRDSVISYES